MTHRFSFSAVVFGSLSFFVGVGLCAPCTDPGSIKKVSKTRSGSFEYVVFDYIKPPDPTYSVDTAHRPFAQDGSGDPVFVKGNRFKGVTFRSAVWTCTIQTNFSSHTTEIRDIKSVGQFEGDISYVIGYKKKANYISNYFYDVGSIRKIVVKFRR